MVMSQEARLPPGTPPTVCPTIRQGCDRRPPQSLGRKPAVPCCQPNRREGVFRKASGVSPQYLAFSLAFWAQKAFNLCCRGMPNGAYVERLTPHVVGAGILQNPFVSIHHEPPRMVHHLFDTTLDTVRRSDLHQRVNVIMQQAHSFNVEPAALRDAGHRREQVRSNVFIEHFGPSARDQDHVIAQIKCCMLSAQSPAPALRVSGPVRLAMALIRSIGSTGFETCILKPADMTFLLSLALAYAVSAIARV
jgi:hypothetical protein